MWFACTKHARSVVGRPLFSPVCGRLQRRWLARASAAAAGPDGPRSELGRSSSRLRLVLLQLPQLPRSRFSHLGGSRAPLRAWVVVQRRRAQVGRRSARGSAETRPRGGVCFVLGFVIMATSLAKREKPHGKRLVQPEPGSGWTSPKLFQCASLSDCLECGPLCCCTSLSTTLPLSNTPEHVHHPMSLALGLPACPS